MLSSLRRIATQAPKLRRGFAGGHDHHHHPYHEPGVPHPSNLDHVFGDSSYKLPYDFQPPSIAFSLATSAAMIGIFFFPLWLYVSEENTLLSFEAKIAEARAAKEAAASE